MADKLLKYDVAMESTKTVWQMDTPKCYTGDENTVTFDFNITDLEEADLVGVIPNVYLYMRDGSFFQNGPADGVDIAGTKVNYTMKGNEGKHSGIAKAQLVLVWDDGVNPAEKLMSQLYEFEVVSGLENKVAVEVMIQDWTTLTKEARTFIDTSADEVDALKGELQTALNTANTSLGEFDVALQNGIVATNIAAELQNLEETYAPDIVSIKGQLADINTDFQTAAANLTIDSEVILARNGFGSLDLRLTNTDAKLSRPQIPVYDFDPETPLVGEMWLIEPSLAKDNFTQPDGLPDANKWLFTKTKRTDTTAVHSVETAATIVNNSCNIKSSVLLGTEDTKHVEVALRLLSSKVNWTTADRKIKWKQTIGVFGSAGVYLSTAVVVDGGTVMKYTFRVISDTTTTYVQIINASTLVYNQSFAHGKNLANGLQAFEIEIDKTAGKINIYLNGVLKLSPDLILTTITDTYLYFYQTTNSTSLQTTIIDDVVVR